MYVLWFTHSYYIVILGSVIVVFIRMLRNTCYVSLDVIIEGDSVD